MRSLRSSKAKIGIGNLGRRNSAFGETGLRSSETGSLGTIKSQWTIRTRSTSETERLGSLAGRAARGGEVLALSGELGSGKTCFIRGFAVGVGASPLAVTSPTFVFIHEYVGRVRLVHADLFRLESIPAYQDLGLADQLNEKTVVAIEWPEKAECELPGDRLVVQLSHKSKNVRELRFQAYGAGSTAFLSRLRRLTGLPVQGPHFARVVPRTHRKHPK